MRWIYVVAAGIGAVGVVIAAMSVGLVLRQALSSFPFRAYHVVGPGRTEIVLAEPGRYTIGYEYRTSLGGRKFATPPDFPPLDLELAAPVTGQVVPIHPHSIRVDYTTATSPGVALGDFQAPRAGTYVLTAQYLNVNEGPQVVLAVGRAWSIGLPGEVGFVLGFFLVVAGVATEIAAIVAQRSRH